MIRKDFYERLLVAKLISKCLSKGEEEFPIVEAFRYVQTKEDEESSDYVWLLVGGNSMKWSDQLLYIILYNLNIPIQQPGYDPLSVTEETLNSDKNYKDWYEQTWKPLVISNISKYKYLYQGKLESKTTRGALDVVSMLDSMYKETDKSMDKISVFGNR